jgi:hypothetical protein
VKIVKVKFLERVSVCFLHGESKCIKYCFGSMRFCGGSGSADPCLRLIDPVFDWDPAVIDHDTREKIFVHIFFVLNSFGMYIYIIYQIESERVEKSRNQCVF